MTKPIAPFPPPLTLLPVGAPLGKYVYTPEPAPTIKWGDEFKKLGITHAEETLIAEKIKEIAAMEQKKKEEELNKEALVDRAKLLMEGPPTWPLSLKLPGAWGLSVPGWQSDEHRRCLGSASAEAQYYNTLMEELWQDTPGSAWQIHTKLLKKSQATQQTKEALKTMAEEKLPEAANHRPEVYTVADHPFFNEEQVDQYGFYQIAYRIKVAKLRFEIAGPKALNHNGAVNKFIGMETYILTWIDFGGPGESALLYFDPKDAGLPKLYGLNTVIAENLFGRGVLQAIEEVSHDVYKSEGFQAIFQDVQKRKMAERYEGSSIGFGSW